VELGEVFPEEVKQQQMIRIANFIPPEPLGLVTSNCGLYSGIIVILCNISMPRLLMINWFDDD